MTQNLLRQRFVCDVGEDFWLHKVSQRLNMLNASSLEGCLRMCANATEVALQKGQQSSPPLFAHFRADREAAMRGGHRGRETKRDAGIQMKAEAAINWNYLSCSRRGVAPQRVAGMKICPFSLLLH